MSGFGMADGFANVALGAVNNAVTGLINYGISNMSNEWAWQRNLDMWNMQNEYNSPLNQMGRFREAGLNPNLIYGQGNPGNATPPPQRNATPYHMDPVNVAQILQANRQLDIQEKLADNTIKKTDAEIEFIDTRSKSAKVKSLGQVLQNERATVENKLYYFMENAFISNRDNRDWDSLYINDFLHDFNEGWTHNQRASFIAKVYKDIELINARIPNITAQTTWQEFQNQILEEDIDLGIANSGGGNLGILKIIYRLLMRLLGGE